jgi:DNA polymerase-1
VLAHLDEIKKPKLKQNLTEHAEMARLSRQLVELVCDAPLPEPIDALAMKGIPDAPLREFLEYHGFKTCSAASTARAGRGDRTTEPTHVPTQEEVRPEPTIDRSLYETVTTEEALDRWIAVARARGFLALDTRTDGRDCVTAKLSASA